MTLITKQEKEFSFLANLDLHNQRIWLHDYHFREATALRNYLVQFTQEQGLEKIIFPVQSKDLSLLEGNGFVKEGMIEGYFSGQDAHFLTAYTSKKRKTSKHLPAEQQMLEEILAQPARIDFTMPEGFELKKATVEDAQAMAFLFSKVFSSYPSPVFDPLYLTRAMQKGDLYLVVCAEEKLVGIATAEIDWDHSRAELTNCATDPHFRGLGLNTLLLKNLELACLTQQINCLYSLARASSYGMNLVLHRLGYQFRGTLINNCHIAGDYEDMNIWVKPSL